MGHDLGFGGIVLSGVIRSPNGDDLGLRESRCRGLMTGRATRVDHARRGARGRVWNPDPHIRSREPVATQFVTAVRVLDHVGRWIVCHRYPGGGGWIVGRRVEVVEWWIKRHGISECKRR